MKKGAGAAASAPFSPVPPAGGKGSFGKGAVSRRLTEDCILAKPKCTKYIRFCKLAFILYISPAAKYNPPPQCAHWGTSFAKGGFSLPYKYAKNAPM